MFPGAQLKINQYQCRTRHNMNQWQASSMTHIVRRYPYGGYDGENVASTEGKISWVIAIECVQCHNLCFNRPFHLKRKMKTTWFLTHYYHGEWLKWWGILFVYIISSIGVEIKLVVNTLRPRRNCLHFADDIFNCIFMNEDIWISIKISLKFVPEGPINNFAALVQIMAWRRPGDKPSSEQRLDILLTHKCVTRPQRANINFQLRQEPVYFNFIAMPRTSCYTSLCHHDDYISINAPGHQQPSQWPVKAMNML